jgi:hypothetical protein
MVLKMAMIELGAVLWRRDAQHQGVAATVPGQAMTP